MTPEVIAVQGMAGCFSDEAAAAFAPEALVLHCNRMEDAFQAVMQQHAGALVLPVFNTIAGYILPHLELAAAQPTLREAATVEVSIQMCLMAPAASSPEGLRRVLSHPVALAQCSKFFAAYPQLAGEAYFDTAGAAAHVAYAGDPELAAIAGERAALQYGLHVLARGIQDRDDNFTRFVLLTR